MSKQNQQPYETTAAADVLIFWATTFASRFHMPATHDKQPVRHKRYQGCGPPRTEAIDNIEAELLKDADQIAQAAKECSSGGSSSNPEFGRVILSAASLEIKLRLAVDILNFTFEVGYVAEGNPWEPNPEVVEAHVRRRERKVREFCQPSLA